MSANIRESKISASTADEEARELLRRLSSGGAEARSVGLELNDRYSLMPRRSILASFRSLLSDKRVVVPPDALLGFLTSQLIGVKDPQLTGQLQETAAVALELPDGVGLSVAAEVFASVLGDLTRTPIRIAGIANAPSILTVVLTKLSETSHQARERVIRWTHVAQPLLNPIPRNNKSRPFNAEEASQILGQFSSLPSELLSDELYACVPSLLVLADREGAERFLNSGMGRSFVNAISRVVAPAAVNEVDIDKQPKAIRCEKQPYDRLSELLNEVEKTIKEMAANHHGQVNDLKEQLKESRQELDRFQEEARQSELEMRNAITDQQVRADTLQASIEERDAMHKQVMIANERLRADLGLIDANSRRDLCEQEELVRRRIGEAINDSVCVLRKDIERALEKHTNDESIQNIGISFDSLHRKLLREAKHLDSTRLPRKLVDREESKG